MERKTHEQRKIDRENIVLDYNEGVSVEELAKLYDLSPGYVDEVLRLCGVRKRRPRDRLTSFKALGMLFLDISEADIARQLHCSRQWINSVKHQALENGIPLPDFRRTTE